LFEDEGVGDKGVIASVIILPIPDLLQFLNAP
jgi:hypothetical protein